MNDWKTEIDVKIKGDSTVSFFFMEEAKSM